MRIESFGGGAPKRLILIILLLQAVTSSFSHARRFNFTQPGEDSPTILLEADFVITIKAFEKDMVVAEWIGGSHDHPNIEIFGISDKRSTIELRFPQEGITWGLSFNEKSLHDIAVDRFVRFTPELIFPPFDKLRKPLTFKDLGNTDYHSALKSFQCDHTIKRIYEPETLRSGRVSLEVSVIVSNFRVQAYHIENGKFSPADHCLEDHVTTPSHVLTSKKTTPKPTHIIPIPKGMPKHKFVVHEVVNNNTIECISMEGRVHFEIGYDSYNGQYKTTRRMVKVGIPEEFTIGGVCKPDDAGLQKLVVNFLDHWAFEISFGINAGYSVPTETGTYQSKLDYSINSVTLNYNIENDERFPQAFKSEGSNFTINFKESDILPRKKAASNYFVCKSPKRLRMNDDVTLVLSDFKFKAFIRDGNTNFYGIPNTCKEDMKKIGASTVVIVVGCLVITLSVVIFIALLALISNKCRKKTRRRRYQAL